MLVCSGAFEADFPADWFPPLTRRTKPDDTLGPAQALVIDEDGKQSLFTPTILLDFLGRTPLAAVAGRGPPHCVISGSEAA